VILKGVASRRYFWLTAQEKRRFKILHKKTLEAKRKKVDAVACAESAGITKNQDGQYSARSNQGKEIRRTIDDSNEIIKNAGRELNELANKPLDGWIEADKCFQNLRAAKWGISNGGVLLQAERRGQWLLYFRWPSFFRRYYASL